MVNDDLLGGYNMIRKWYRDTDNGAVHALGNGRILIYAIGPEILQIVGAPYSAESLGTLTIPSVNNCSSERLPKTAIWKHTLDNGTVMTDVVDSQMTCFIRKINATCDFTMVLQTNEAFLCNEKGDIYSFHSPNGNSFFTYKTPLVIHHSIAATGNASINEISEHTYEIYIRKGESNLIFANSPSVIKQIEQISFNTVLKRTSNYWYNFINRGKEIPATLSELCENVAIMIKCQQGEDGGILAGYPFHLAYIRDQYGTVRGLLKMGFLREAEAVMRYYLNIWKKYGSLHTAQSVGKPCVFHIHENENVEITGYLAIMPFEVYRYNGDRSFLEELLPMVRWALDCQAGELKNGMLPFNGDETYIAGRFLPRAVMYEGSAEATMLFAEGIQRYQEYTGDMHYASYLKDIKDTYVQHFCPNGRYITNYPPHTPVEEYPDSRHGVCEDCNNILTTLTKTSTNRYVCSKCINHTLLPAWKPKIYELAASKLAPIYIGASLVPDEIIESYLDEMANLYLQTGEMPSGCPKGECVGYDYGMFLYALTLRHHPSAKQLYELTLKVIDETGVWCEYYRDGIARSTRCRPWESAINIEAVLTYLEQSNKTDKK